MRAPPHLHQSVLAPSVGSLTERQQRFVAMYMETGGKQTEAAIEAGYARESAQTTASRMLRLPHVQQAIMRETLVRIGLQAVPALHTLERLRDSARSDYVRLEAAKDLLDRAGFRPPERVDHRLDASLTVELVLSSQRHSEGGSKTADTGYSHPPDTGKSRPEDGAEVGFVIEEVDSVSEAGESVGFFTEDDVFSTTGEDPQGESP